MATSYNSFLSYNYHKFVDFYEFESCTMRFSCGSVAAFNARILDGCPPVIYRSRMHEILMHELNIYFVFIQIKPYPYTHAHI